METIKATIEKTDLPMRKSSQPSPLVSVEQQQANKITTINGECYISRYQDGPPLPEDFAIAVKKLSVAFPQQSPEFFSLAVEEMAQMGFTRQRMADAVTNLIRTFQYKQPNISDIVSYDKKHKIYTYGQMLSKLVCNGGTEPTTDSFSIVKIDGKTYYYLPNENI